MRVRHDVWVGPQDERAETVSTVLASNLRRLRSRTGLSQTEVAAGAGISRTHYSALESGVGSSGGAANPRLITLVDLAAALRTNLAEVVAGLPPSDPDEAIGPRG